MFGKAGPDKHKSEDDQIEAILDDQRPASQKQVRGLFSLVGLLGKNQKVQSRIVAKGVRAIVSVQTTRRGQQSTPRWLSIYFFRQQISLFH